MTRPRQVLPEKTYMVTRNCSQRQFFLRPCDEINQLFLYSLAVASQRYDIRIHAFVVLSNHFHIILHDRCAKLPRAMLWIDGVIARALNAFHRRAENFFAPGSYSRVELTADEDILEKMVYVLANPVAAGLVSRGSEWPGVRSTTLRGGRVRLTIERPKAFFSPRSRLPEKAELVVERPSAFEDLSDEEFGELFDGRVERHEAELARAQAREGRKPLGPKRIKAQRFTSKPSKPREKGGIDPQVAGRDKWRRIEKLRELGEWIVEYHAARLRFCAGERRVLFPAGTYWLRIHYRVRCRKPP